MNNSSCVKREICAEAGSLSFVSIATTRTFAHQERKPRSPCSSFRARTPDLCARYPDTQFCFDRRIIPRTHGLEETGCLYMRSANSAGHHFEEITETTIKSVAERLARFEPKHFRLVVQKIADCLRGKYVPGPLADDSTDVGCSRDPPFPQPLSQIPYNWHQLFPLLSM